MTLQHSRSSAVASNNMLCSQQLSRSNATTAAAVVFATPQPGPSPKYHTLVDNHMSSYFHSCHSQKYCCCSTVCSSIVPRLGHHHDGGTNKSFKQHCEKKAGCTARLLRRGCSVHTACVALKAANAQASAREPLDGIQVHSSIACTAARQCLL